MRCPFCQAPDARVTDSRDVEGGVRRRRECTVCGRRFTTYERLAPTVWVIKRDGRREEFNPAKVLEGLRKACTKRPVPAQVLERIVQEVQDAACASGSEISSRAIGDMVMRKLREVDEVAYIRFASVYLPLSDLESIRGEVERLMDERKPAEA
jgi:transcriptional repressor NrdR